MIQVTARVHGRYKNMSGVRDHISGVGNSSYEESEACMRDDNTESVMFRVKLV